MKRFENLITLIKDLPDKWEDANSLHPAIIELEAVFKEFYQCGYEFGDKFADNGRYDIQIDFSNRLSNFYTYDEP